MKTIKVRIIHGMSGWSWHASYKERGVRMTSSNKFATQQRALDDATRFLRETFDIDLNVEGARV